jgi:peptidase M48-like protein/PDZ domain-containing protein
MPRPRFLVPLAVLAFTCGCAQIAPTASPDSTSAPSAQVENAGEHVPDALGDPIRLFKVAYPLLRAAHDFCKHAQGYAVGLYALNRFGMGRFEDVASTYGIGDELKVLFTVPNGPAYRAGIRTGDVVLSVNGERTPTDAHSTAIFSGKMAVLARTGLPVEFSLRRDSKILKTTVQPEPICGYSVQVSPQPRIDAVADGSKHIAVSRGMMQFAKTDADLALVLAHEIAHNVMGHQRTKIQLQRSSAEAHAADTAPRRLNPVYSRALESDADYVGLYIMARADMPIEDAPKLLERMAAAAAARGADPYPTSHPPSKQRLMALQKTIREIERKRAAGAPLVPDAKTLKISELRARNG